MATLLELRTQVRQRADMVNSQFISDSELNSYINSSLSELYDILIQTVDDYFVNDPTEFTLTSGQSTYTLPADFYKLRGLDLKLSDNKWVTLESFNFADRNSSSGVASRVYLGRKNLAYRIVGQKIRFKPEDQAAGTYRLWYYPRLTRLSSDSDQTTGFLDWEEYVIVDAAIKCLQKEESDPSVLMAQKAQLKERIDAMAADRDLSSPEVVADVRSYSPYPYSDDSGW